ncbi:MAG: hypothetical protein IH852_01360 [Bacteroidetes bacterium]|nr:hypothetical protein [Bacteroidota bacterium]
MNSTIKTYYFISILFLSHLVTGIFAQPINDPGTQSFLYPQRMQSGNLKYFAGMSLANLPEDVIESDDLFRAPLFKFNMLYGIPHNFLIDGSLNTNLITWQFSIGAKWNYVFDKFSFALGYDVAYMFGGLRQFGFDSSIKGWINYPNLAIGYKFKKFTISVKGELILITSMKQTADDLEVASDINTFSGYSVTMVVEQPLWKDNYILVGLKINWVKFYYPQWAAFSTFDRLFFIPEITVGFVL